MQKRRLGRTEHQSSVAILGGAVFASDSPETAEIFFYDDIKYLTSSEKKEFLII